MKNVLPVLVALTFVACGGDGASPGPSTGLPRSATVGSLSAAQAGTLCDWTNSKQGGYGRAVACSDGSEQGTDPDKASCVESIPYFGVACPTLTVANVEDCVNAIGQDVCQLQTNAACAELKVCFDSLGI